MREEYFSHHYVTPFFHRQARRAIRAIRRGVFPPPLFKEYPRMPETLLEEPSMPPHTLPDLLEHRRSFRSFEHAQGLTKAQISTILAYGFRKRRGEGPDGEFRGYYPSSGARYPLECYLAIVKQREGGLEPGLYHYNPISHSLRTLLPGTETKELLESALTYRFSKLAPAFIFITATWQRNLIKYKDFGYPLILMEAGHASQNVLLVAEAHGVKTCSLAGFHQDETCRLLDVDGIVEAPIHLIALGDLPQKTEKLYTKDVPEDDEEENPRPEDPQTD